MITSTLGWAALWILAGSLAVAAYLVARLLVRSRRGGLTRFYGFCGVCGQPMFTDPADALPLTFTNRQVGTTADGKPMVRPYLDQPIRMDPYTGAVCTCPPLGGTR